MGAWSLYLPVLVSMVGSERERESVGTDKGAGDDVDDEGIEPHNHAPLRVSHREFLKPLQQTS
jgi:hypothetical protein